MAQGAYVFGYGSLIESESRTRTNPDAVAAWPARLAGYQRGWFHMEPTPDRGPNCVKPFVYFNLIVQPTSNSPATTRMARFIRCGLSSESGALEQPDTVFS